MKSRTSLFSGTVLKKDILRFCPVWIIFSVVILIPTMGELSTFYYLGQDNYFAAQMGQGIGGWAIISFLYALV